MNYHLVQPEKIGAMVEWLEKHPAVAFDVETTGLDPYTGELRLLQFAADAEKAFIVDLWDDFDSPTRMAGHAWSTAIKRLLENPNIVKIGHNLKFDCKWAKHHLGAEVRSIYDTMLGSIVAGRGQKVDANGERVRHGLGFVAERYLGIEVDKTYQRSDWSQEKLSTEQLTYAAKDVCVLPALMEAQKEALEKFGLNEAMEIENDIVMAMAQLELNGFYLHAPAWRQQVVTAKGQERRMADKLQDIFYAGSRQTGLFGRIEIDLGSWQQVQKALLSLGVPLEDGSTNENKIGHLADQFECVDALLEWRGYNKQVTSYGDAFLEYINPETGRIHGDFMQIEAPSGRMGSGKPNLQNIPADSTYRNCFRAPEGKRLVVADYSQIELRVLAEMSKDQVMIDAFDGGRDYHTEIASQVFNVAYDTVTPEQRSFAKRVNFGVAYGIGVGKLSRMTGMDFDTTKAFLKKYYTGQPQMDSYLKRAAWTTVKTRQAKNMSGRIARWGHINPDHADPEQARINEGRLQRLGKNAPIQGSAADIFKRGLCLIHNDLRGTDAKIVNLVHDEYVIECSSEDAEDVAYRVKELAEQAGREYLKTVPCKVDVKIMEEWSK